jgi:hypothetical protein
VYNVDLVMCCLVSYLFVFILAIWFIRYKVARQTTRLAQAETLPHDEAIVMEEEAVA